MVEPGRANQQPQGGAGARCASPVRPPARGRRSRRSRAADPAGWGGGIVERHLRLVALEGDDYPAPRRPADDAPRLGGGAGGADWLGDRFTGDPSRGEAERGRSGRAGSGRGVEIKVMDVRPASRIADRTAGAPAPWADPNDPEDGSRPAAGTDPHADLTPGRRAADPERRPVRLTRRGRLVMLALVLFVGALVGFLVATPGQAADPPKPAVTAVVQPGDTLWAFAERNLPNWRTQAAVAELKQLNDLEGYVIHPGQQLVLPAR